jgi:hypothetical protein
VPVDQQVSALRAALPSSIDAADIHPRLTEALQAERTWAVADAAQVKLLAEQLDNDAQIVEVPAFDEDVHDLAALAKVAGYLTDAA